MKMRELLKTYQKVFDDVDTSELADATPTLVGHNETRETRFFGLGPINKDGDHLFGGVKVDDDGNERRFRSELAAMVFVGTKTPEVIGKMASFYALLQNENGESVGILTEDFTRGGLLKGRQFPTSVTTERSILDACGDTVYPADIRRMACYFGDIGDNEEILVDFKPLLTQKGWRDPLLREIREEIHDIISDGTMTVILPSGCNLIRSL